MEYHFQPPQCMFRGEQVIFHRRYTEQFILPIIGKMRLQAIAPAHIRQLYLRMQMEGKGARTIQLIHVTLRCAFAQAVKEGLIGHNPLDAVERPKAETKQFEILTEKQARDFLTAAKGHKYEALYYLALTTSLRKGEILGRMWTNVDWKKGTLRIERQLQQASWRGADLAPTKTKSSRRQIKLGHRARQCWKIIGRNKRKKSSWPVNAGRIMA